MVKPFGIGIGTHHSLAGNVVLLGGYTFGCHSLRHLVGGAVDLLSKAPIRRWLQLCSRCLNSSAHALGMDESLLGRFFTVPICSPFYSTTAFWY